MSGETSGAQQFPSLFVDADRASTEGQRRYLRATLGRLVAAVLAALFATFAAYGVSGGIEWFAMASAAAFLVALGFEVWLLADQPEKAWYVGRALAESSKTVAWKYAVKALPFVERDREARLHVHTQLDLLLRDAEDIGIVSDDEVVITPWMTGLRGETLPQRRTTYIAERVEDQKRWYAHKAAQNRDRARLWKAALIVAELVGIGLALAKALEFITVDLSSIISTAIAAGAAWLGVRQYEALSKTYAFASHELALIADRLQEVTSEEEWAREVAHAEEAIGREHTMWRASRITGSALNRRLDESHGLQSASASGPGTAHAPLEVRASYLAELAKQIRAASGDVSEGARADLCFLIYAVLLRAKGADVTSSDIHDGWVAMAEFTGYDGAHEDLVPFEELSAATQSKDTLYAAAIRAVVESA